MKKYIIAIVLIVNLSSFCFAQFNFSQIQNQHAHNLGSALLPSLLGDDIRTGEVHLFSPNIGFANNFISAYDIQQLSNSGSLTNASIDQILNKIP